MSSASPSASSLAAAAHRRPRWTSPRATPSLPTTTMLSTLSSLHPQPRTKTLTSARRWRSKACVSAHSRTVPLPLTSVRRLCVSAFADGADAADIALSRCRHRRSLRAACLASLNWTMRTCLRGKRKPGRLHRKQRRDAMQNGLIESGK